MRRTARPGGLGYVSSETRVLSSVRIWAAMALPSMSLEMTVGVGVGVDDSVDS